MEPNQASNTDAPSLATKFFAKFPKTSTFFAVLGAVAGVLTYATDAAKSVSEIVQTVTAIGEAPGTREAIAQAQKDRCNAASSLGAAIQLYESANHTARLHHSKQAKRYEAAVAINKKHLLEVLPEHVPRLYNEDYVLFYQVVTEEFKKDWGTKASLEKDWPDAKIVKGLSNPEIQDILNKYKPGSYKKEFYEICRKN